MAWIIVMIVVGIIVVVGCIVCFILFLRSGAKGAKEDRTLFEKGQITAEQYESGYDQGTAKVVQDNYEHLRNLSEEDKKRLDQFRGKKS